MVRQMAQPALFASSGNDLQQVKVEVNAVHAPLRRLFLIQSALKGIRREPMRGILVLQPASSLALVLLDCARDEGGTGTPSPRPARFGAGQPAFL